MSTDHDFTVFRKFAGDKIAELTDRAEKAERELAAKDKEADTARLDWLLQDTELDLFFADREEIDAAMKEDTNETNTT